MKAVIMKLTSPKGLIQRSNDYFYIQKIFKGKLFRFSLHTKDYSIAYYLFTEWHRAAMLAYMSNQPIPCPKGAAEIQRPAPQKFLDTNRPSVISVFNQHIKASANKHITKAHMQSKVRVKNYIVNKGYGWDDFTPETILGIIEAFKKDGGLHTAYKHSCQLRAFFNYAVKIGVYSKNKYARLSFMKSPKPKGSRACISAEDRERIDEHLISRREFDFYFVLRTIYGTGSRPNEIAQLKTSDIDSENITLRVFQSKVNETKTIPLPKEELEALLQYAKIGKDGQDGFIFEGGGRNPEYYGKKFKKLKEELGLNPRYTLYSFRHSAATKAASHGNLAQVQALLGHSSPKMTSRYISTEPSALRPLTNALYGRDRKNTAVS